MERKDAQREFSRRFKASKRRYVPRLMLGAELQETGVSLLLGGIAAAAATVVAKRENNSPRLNNFMYGALVGAGIGVVSVFAGFALEDTAIVEIGKRVESDLQELDPKSEHIKRRYEATRDLVRILRSMPKGIRKELDREFEKAKSDT